MREKQKEEDEGMEIKWNHRSRKIDLIYENILKWNKNGKKNNSMGVLIE